MKTETYLFAGVALFFLVTDAFYIAFAREPAGAAALTVSFAMSALIAFFCAVTYRRTGRRPEDRKEAEVRERGGPLGFFPPHAATPVLTALGVAVMAVGVVFGLWLFAIGVGVTAVAVFHMVFQYAERDQEPGAGP
ncbi:cytochrome c oxidase subunit 4 [Streptomyces sp. CC228A]|uniref:aa3-type cytochrome oxidase subunit IV n=1 Tax=Streptomyces sp. CC228A TaxID=2898186 RepID=UPI001F249962|nr:cytochrome c oxidase subunit 4 [Streptomyces sp. CC228A]